MRNTRRVARSGAGGLVFAALLIAAALTEGQAISTGIGSEALLPALAAVNA